MPPSWLADEMLGRLARYLRILGCDTEYVRGSTDGQILEQLKGSSRILLTRDRDLFRRAARSTLIRSVEVSEQLRELWAAYPELARRPSFDRCTLCNGMLSTRNSAEPAAPPIPAQDKFRCMQCGQEYWRGTHTARLESDLARWAAELS
ncbi:MAG: Mut7-C RNAse domain-containing protein [Thermoplasmata archaeon]|nr:Mut7-C RNAse domain-containing protein [Thermoplasmata archaeon]MCI4341985.1 Mut7-C RNAse domain-containing protein [Thermoplasmata archaeon]